MHIRLYRVFQIQDDVVKSKFLIISHSMIPSPNIIDDSMISYVTGSKDFQHINHSCNSALAFITHKPAHD